MPTQVHLHPTTDIPTLRKDGFEDEILNLVAQIRDDLDALVCYSTKAAIKSWDYWKERSRRIEIANDGTFVAPVWEADSRAKNTLMISHYAPRATSFVKGGNVARYPSFTIRLGDEIRFVAISPHRPLVQTIQGWVVISKESDAMLLVRDESCPVSALEVFNRFNLWRVLLHLNNLHSPREGDLPQDLGLAPDQFSASDFFWGLLEWADLPDVLTRAVSSDEKPRIGPEARILLSWLSFNKPPGFFRELMHSAMRPDYQEEMWVSREGWLRILARVCARSVFHRRCVRKNADATNNSRILGVEMSYRYSRGRVRKPALTESGV